MGVGGIEVVGVGEGLGVGVGGIVVGVGRVVVSETDELVASEEGVGVSGGEG